MLPLPFLWKWLWINFTPLEDQRESSPEEDTLGAQSETSGVGLEKDVVVKELLSTKEVNKEGNAQVAAFAKALIGRYLCVLFKDSAHCRTRFTDAKNSTLYTVCRTSSAQHEARLKEVPAFPQDLRVKILQELKEERLGRTSARNLLQLMTQPARLETSSSTSTATSPERPPSSSSSPSSSRPAAHRKRHWEDDQEGQQQEGSQGPSAQKRIVLANPRRASLKRSLSMSGSSVGVTVQEEGDFSQRPPQKARLETDSASPLSPDKMGNVDSSQTSAAAAMGRLLRRQVSTPVLPTQTARVSGGSGAAPSTIQLEPWKREINDLWAKQLAMLREINTLKNELGRREAARQREILGLRQEIDALRVEVFRLRPTKGLKQNATENNMSGAGKTSPQEASSPPRLKADAVLEKTPAP